MVSDKKVKELEQSAVELTLTVGAQDVQSSYDEVLKKYMKSAHIKGFRKGKVPVAVLEKKYGDALREESMLDIMDAALKEALEEIDDAHRPLPYSQPTLVKEDETKLELNSDFSFSVTYDVYPKIVLNKYSEYEVEVPKVVVGEEDIQRELTGMQEQNAMVIETDESAGEKSIVTVNYWQFDDDGNEMPDTRREDFTFTIGSGYNYYHIDEDVIGMKKGDAKTVTKDYPEDFEVEDLAGKSVKLQVEIIAVKKRDIPELDDEFAQDVSEKYETLADLKQDITDRMNKDLENQMKDLKISRVVNKIIEDNPFSIPDSMVEAQLEDSWNSYVARYQMPEEQLMKFLEMQGVSKETIIEGWREDAAYSLKHSVVIQSLADKEQIEVSDEEADKALEEELAAAGQTEELKPEMKEYYRHMQKAQLKNQRAAEVLLEKNTFKEGKEMSLEDFIQGKSDK